MAMNIEIIIDALEKEKKKILISQLVNYVGGRSVDRYVAKVNLYMTGKLKILKNGILQIG